MSQENSRVRDLFGPGQGTAIRDLLQSLFVAELLSPSRRLWLLFGWISDIALIDNRARQFSALQPDWPASEIRLSSILNALLNRGGSIVLILREVKHNLEFVNRIASLQAQYPDRLRLHLAPDVHDKGILGDDFLVSGSMNLTFNGITVNDEHLTLRTDPASIEEWRMTLEQKWKEILK
jgi:hypothetical protein